MRKTLSNCILHTWLDTAGLPCDGKCCAFHWFGTHALHACNVARDAAAGARYVIMCVYMSASVAAVVALHGAAAIAVES